MIRQLQYSATRNPSLLALLFIPPRLEVYSTPLPRLPLQKKTLEVSTLKDEEVSNATCRMFDVDVNLDVDVVVDVVTNNYLRPRLVCSKFSVQ